MRLVLTTDMEALCQNCNKGNLPLAVPALAKLIHPISQYYAIAACTILFYDYLLTLADEARRVYSVSCARC